MGDKREMGDTSIANRKLFPIVLGRWRYAPIFPRAPAQHNNADGFYNRKRLEQVALFIIIIISPSRQQQPAHNQPTRLYYKVGTSQTDTSCLSLSLSLSSDT